MKLIVLYGPPAVGKLTIARELSKLTGFRVFHNHLSIDAVEPIFDFGTPPFAKMVEMMRFAMVGEAAMNNIDLIYTFCYAKGHDEPHLNTIAKLVEGNGGEVQWVLLVCDKEELKRRVLSEDRKKYGKAKTVELMDRFFEMYDLFSPLPGSETLTIDNTDVPAAKAARTIIERLGIAEVGSA